MSTCEQDITECKKTELIFFRKPNTCIPSHKIKINGIKLCPSKNIKYLGIYLDEHLTGVTYAEILIPKLRRACGMLSKIRHYTTCEQTKTIYHAIFSSHMTYGCQFWGQSHNKNIINKIQTLQNNATRLVTFAPNFRDHVTPDVENNLLKISDIISQKNLLFIHDSLSNKLPSNLNNFSTINDNPHPLDDGEVRNFNPPIRFTDFILDHEFPLQEHQEIYRYKNINVPGQLQKPNYDTIKYGRNSLKVTSILTYNHMKKEFPETDFISLRRIEFKNLITRHYLGQYKNQT